MARSDLREEGSESESENRQSTAELASEGSDENSEVRRSEISSQTRSRRNASWSWMRLPFLRQGSSRRRSSSRQYHHSRRCRSRSSRNKQRNFPSAVCSIIVIVILSTAMVAPNWFYLRGGGCRDKANSPVHTLSIYRFFYLGHFVQYEVEKTHTEKITTEYTYSPSRSDVLIDCVSTRVVHVLRSVISLCFIGIAFSFMAFFLDLMAPSNKLLVVLRRNAIFNIVTVMVCVTINGFCFMVTQLLEAIQKETKPNQFSKVEIQFDIGFYLVAGAGGMSILAVACNLLRRQPLSESSDYHSSDQRVRLLDDYDEMQQPVLDLQPDYYAPMHYLPPPPAYTP